MIQLNSFLLRAVDTGGRLWNTTKKKASEISALQTVGGEESPT